MIMIIEITQDWWARAGGGATKDAGEENQQIQSKNAFMSKKEKHTLIFKKTQYKSGWF